MGLASIDKQEDESVLRPGAPPGKVVDARDFPTLRYVLKAPVVDVPQGSVVLVAEGSLDLEVRPVGHVKFHRNGGIPAVAMGHKGLQVVRSAQDLAEIQATQV